MPDKLLPYRVLGPHRNRKIHLRKSFTFFGDHRPAPRKPSAIILFTMHSSAEQDFPSVFAP